MEISQETRDSIKDMSTKALNEMARLHRECLDTEADPIKRETHRQMLDLFVYQLRHRKHKRF